MDSVMKLLLVLLLWIGITQTSLIIASPQKPIAHKVLCSPKAMVGSITVNTTTKPIVYLEKFKGLSANSICAPKLIGDKIIYQLPLNDKFYLCGTTKIYDKLRDLKIYYNNLVIEDVDRNQTNTLQLKCVIPNEAQLMAKYRSKRQTYRELPINFTEIDLPENFMEAEELDFTDNITVSAPYPDLNVKVRQNGVFVDTAINVQPGTPLEMIIYLDEKSKHVYGLLTSFLKVTDNTVRQQEEVITLNGCSIDPYIFGNFESSPGGDAVSAKFRAFKFPESNFVMFVGTVNVCLNECKGVPCGNGQYGFGRKKRSYKDPIPTDPNKVFEIEMTTVFKVGYK